MPSFEVEEYTVRSVHGVGGYNYRMLLLTSIAYAHGIRSHASIWFYDSLPNSLGGVHNVDQPNFHGLEVAAYLRKADYADWYDLLRSEEPVTLSYGYTPQAFDPQRSLRTLVAISLGTGPEPVGEGPEDESP